jgi:D-alanyl-D-alanine carboxypeptidase
VPNHYTTPHDLAVFTMYAMQFPRFVRAMSSQTYETSDGSYALVNNNRLMNSYDSLVGGKTGYDLDSGWCLIEVASRNGNTMISVTFDGIHPDDWYDDNRVLLEYALDQKERQQASGPPAGAQFVSFKDPDAAVIARSAQTGGSLAKVSVFEAADQPAASAPRLVPAGDFEAPAGDDRQLIGALGAVGVVMLAGLSRALFGGRVRHAPAPAMTSSDRRRRLSRLTRSSALPTRPGSLDT